MKKFIFSVFIVAICSYSGLVSAQFDVSPNNKIVEWTSGSTTYSVNSGVGWSVSDNASWCTATKIDGSTISVSYDANTSKSSSRRAYITATGTGGVTETVSLDQDFPFLYTDLIYHSASSGSTNIYVYNNMFDWSVTDDASWLTVTRIDKYNLRVTFEYNSSTSERIANITFDGTEGVTEVIAATQGGAPPFLAVSPDSRDADLSSGTATYYVSTNVGWSVSDDATWCTATKTDGSTISVSYGANNTGGDRTANITVSGTGGLGETVELWQDLAYVSFEGDGPDLSAASGTDVVYVSTNLLEFNVTDDASWLTITRADGSRKLDISYEANPSTTPRTARITVSGIGEMTVSGYLDLDQAGASPFLAVSPDNRDVDFSSGTATYYVSTNVGWSVSDDATWCTATKTDGSTISVSYGANSTGGDRSANITVTGTGGITETVTLTQEVLIILDVTPNSQNVSTEAGTTSFQVYLTAPVGQGWGVVDDASWLSAIHATGDKVNVSYEANTSINARTANITVDVSQEIKETVTVTQAGVTFDISPDSRSVSAESGTISFDMNSDVGWDVSDDASWLSATKTDGSTISVSYEANTSITQRTANISASGTGGITETVTVTQAGYSDYIDVSPSSKFVEATSGTTSFSVSSNVDWRFYEYASWLKATKTDESTISISYDANTSIIERTAYMRAYEHGVDDAFTLKQAGAEAYLELSPNSESVSSASGTTSFSVSTNVGWSVTVDVSWLSATNTDGTTIKVSYDANTSTTPRKANITANGPQGVTETVTVAQDGEADYLELSPGSRSVSLASGTTSFMVSANVEWSVSDDASWLSATKTDGSTISISYDANASTTPRTAQITADGTGGLSETVSVTQSAEEAFLELSPVSRSVSLESGTTSFDVSSNVEWSVSDDASWLSATRTDGSTISVSYSINSSSGSRTANIKVDGTGGVTETVTVTQAGEEDYLEVNPNSRNVSLASGTASFSVSSNVEWSVTDDDFWLSATKTDETTITVSYDANTSTSPRTAQITVDGTGGLTETVSLTQSAESAYLEISPPVRSVSSEPDSTTFTIISNIDWSGSENSEWLSTSRSNDTLLTVYFDENMSVDDRSAILTFSGAGVFSQTASIDQKGAFPAAIINRAENQQLTIYPNPTSDKIFLKLSSSINSEVLISLFDGSGKLLYSRSIDKILSDESIEIDISSFNPGVYILQLNHSNSFIVKKVLKH